MELHNRCLWMGLTADSQTLILDGLQVMIVSVRDGIIDIISIVEMWDDDGFIEVKRYFP